MKRKLFYIGYLTTAVLLFGGCTSKRALDSGDDASENNENPGGPEIGKPMMGGSRPAPSPELQALISQTVPYFRQAVFIDEKNYTLQYNLFTPGNMKEDEKYPLVLFMADASTPGPDPLTPLTQGYGALVWADPEFQREHPCYVLVPQYSYVTVDNAWQTMPEVDQTIELLKEIVKNNPVDSDRLYTTGQSMGGMMSLYFNIKYPDLFAASLFVSCQWDVEKMEGFKNKKFIYITAEGDQTATDGADELRALLTREHSSFDSASWSARLSEQEQDAKAATLLSKPGERFFITFEGDTDLPDGVTDPTPGMVHMASFNYAYRLKPVTEWLLNQHK